MEVAESYQLEFSQLVANQESIEVKPRKRRGNGTTTRIKRRKLLLPNAIDTRNKLSNFVVGKSNLQAYNIAQSIVLNPSREYPFFLLVAPSGLGKTHLLQGMINGLTKYRPEVDYLFYKGNDFKKIVLSDEFNIGRAKAIFIDDFDDFFSCAESQKKFCSVFDYLRAQNIQLVATMSVLPKNIKTTYERFNTRISSAVIQKIDFLDRELGESIIRRKLKEVGLTLREDIITLIADSFHFHVYGIESALLKLKSYRDTYNKELDFDTALKELQSLGQLIDSGDRSRHIIERVAKYFKKDPHELCGPLRRKEIAYVRHVTMYILYKKAGFSYKRIGTMFNRDHTSVIYAITKIQRRVNCDGELQKIVHKLS